MTKLLGEFYKKDVVQRREELAEIERAVEISRLTGYFQRWRNEFAGRQRLKRNMLAFPPAPSMYQPADTLQVRTLHCMKASRVKLYVN